MYGIQLAGFVNQAALNAYGLQLSSLSNITAGDFSGVGITGFLNLMAGDSKGITISGLTNVNGSSHYGLNMAGLLNITGNKGVGVDIAGLGNVSAGEHRGVMISVLSNVTGESLYGIQIAGLMNINAVDMHGVQISPFNVTVKGKGLQLGLVNFYAEDFKGLQLGLVNANPSTKVQWMIYGGSSTKINTAARFKNDLFYTILGVGTHYLDFKDKFSGALFYRAGLGFPIYKNLSLSGDLGYQHIETFKNKNEGFPKRLYALEARLNLEYRLNDDFALFATGGFSHSRHYNKSQMYKNRAIIEAGIILF
ncbi:MAG: hypothetical protein GX905_04945 [Bacteroidales bacterium]|nr:hypothetical protein [Bacteroidales bacterium]